MLFTSYNIYGTLFLFPLINFKSDTNINMFPLLLWWQWAKESWAIIIIILVYYVCSVCAPVWVDSSFPVKIWTWRAYVYNWSENYLTNLYNHSNINFAKRMSYADVQVIICCSKFKFLFMTPADTKCYYFSHSCCCCVMHIKPLVLNDMLT